MGNVAHGSAGINPPSSAYAQSDVYSFHVKLPDGTEKEVKFV